LVRAQGRVLHFLLRSLAIDDSKISIRSADEVWMEGFASSLSGEYCRHELYRGDFMSR